MSGKRGVRSNRAQDSDEDSPPRDQKRHKREPKPSTSQEPMESEDFEPGSWACPICTYRNRCEAYKCEMCEARKGTSTRRLRLDESIFQKQKTLAQNLAAQQPPIAGPSARKHRATDGRSRCSPESSGSGQNSRGLGSSRSSPIPSKAPKKRQPNKSKGRPTVLISDDIIYRSQTTKTSVTANGTTFIITEFKPRQHKGSKRASGDKKERRKREEREFSA